MSTLRSVSSVPTLPSLRSSKSSSQLKSQLLTRAWTSDHRRFLHQQREQRWLRSKAKDNYVDFTKLERTELKRYFDALAEGASTISMDKLEDMLVSFGIADHRADVVRIVEAVDGNACTGLTFEEYLLLASKKENNAIVSAFHAMVEGRIGDRNLNFQTSISAYRRGVIMHATGAGTGPAGEDHKGAKILQNFAALQRRRFEESDLVPSALRPAGEESTLLPFHESGPAPVGGLEMLWRSVCEDHGLAIVRPPSGGGLAPKPALRGLQRPMSPGSVIHQIVGKRPGKKGRAADFGMDAIATAESLQTPQATSRHASPLQTIHSSNRGFLTESSNGFLNDF